MLRGTASVILGFMIAFLFSGIVFHLFNGKNAVPMDEKTTVEWFGGVWAVATVLWYALLRWRVNP